MKYLRNLPISQKLSVITMLISSIALLLACLSFVTYEQVTFRGRVVRDLTILADVTGANSSAGLSFNEPGSAVETLQSLRADARVIRAVVYDRSGAVFAQYHRPGAPADPAPPRVSAAGYTMHDNRIEMYRRIEAKNEFIGTIYVEFDFSELSERRGRYALMLAVLFVICSSVAFFLVRRLRKVIANPIVDLSEMASKVAQERNYGLRAHRESDDEVGRLVSAFNEMLEQIQRRDHALQEANDKLEQRVRERTQQLESESAEHRKTAEERDRFFTVSEDLLCIGTYDGFLRRINPAFHRLLGFTPEELLSQPFLALIHPEDRELTKEKIAGLADGVVVRDFQIRSLHKNGTYRTITWNASPVAEVHGFYAYGRDVTEQRKAEQELRESQALYHSLVENLPVHIFRKDLEGRFVFANSLFCRERGTTPEQLLGNTVDGDVPPELAQRFLDEDRYIVSTGKTIEHESERRTPGQDPVYFHVVKSPVYGGDGRVVGVQGMLYDVTARKRAEAELAYERDLLRTLLDTSPDCIYFKDLQSRFIKCSAAVAKRFNLNPVDVIGKTDFDIFDGEHAREAFDDEQRIIRTGVPVIGKIEREQAPDGREMWVITSKLPFRDKNGKVTGTFGISKDITEMKKAEKELKNLHAKLMETSHRAGMAQVATGVLHNVGNVLNSVNVSSTLITEKIRKSRLPGLSKAAALMKEQEQNLPEFFSNDTRAKQLPGYLSMLAERLEEEHASVLNEMNLLAKHIGHIKEIVAMQQTYAKASGVNELLPPTDLVEDALRMNSAALVRHDVHVVREFVATPRVSVDRHKVLSILINLISNAKYAMDAHPAPRKTLTVRVEQPRSTHVRISVSDNGVGIGEENLKRVFEHGFTTKKNGHGFGLHSSAIAAGELGGSLIAQSEGHEKGATFVLELPVASGPEAVGPAI